MISISVAICTFNPRKNYLNNVLEGLKKQTLPFEHWELLLVDNGSDILIANQYDLSWHCNARHIREDKLGLTHARFRAIEEASGKVLVLVDDDNILDKSYLERSLTIANAYPNIGVFGGKALPEYETEPPVWIQDFWRCLALRNLGEERLISNYSKEKWSAVEFEYPSFAPIGAGMVIRKEVAQQYFYIASREKSRQALDRKGNNLTSGGDNDIVIEAIKQGYEVGYFPDLSLIHLMPIHRVTKEYLSKLNYASSKSWVQLLHLHGVCPWPKIPKQTVLPRKLKAYFTYKAWKNEENYIKWQGACGTFEGLGDLA